MKPRTPFELNVERVRSQLKTASIELDIIKGYMDAGRTEAAYDAAFTFVAVAEKLALLGRTLPAYTGNPAAKQKIVEQMLYAHKIKVGYTKNGWFGVHLPGLLPSKKDENKDFLRIPLYTAIDHFFAGNRPKHSKACTLVIRHRYDKRRAEKLVRDHDNIEVKVVVDAVALFAMRDDAALLCEHHYCSCAAEADETEVYVIPDNEFITWCRLIATGRTEKLELFEAGKTP